MSEYKTIKTTGPHPVDVHVGGKIRQRRTILGISQEKLAESLGLTFQQIQKYETGRNRVSSSRLYEIGKFLSVGINFFFDGFNDGTQNANTLSDGNQTGYDTDDLMKSKETLDLLKAYYAVSDEKLRKDWVKLLKQMSKHIDKDE